MAADARGPWGDARDAFWGRLSKSEVEELVAEDHERAVRARSDVVAFFDYVMREQTKRTRLRVTPHQRVALSFVMHHDRSLLVMPVGASKCHGKGTPILMADATVRPVEEVRVGDRVMGPDGPKTVWAIGNGKGDLFLIRPVKGSPFVVNHDHVLTLVHTETAEVIDIPLREYQQQSKWFRSNYKLFRSRVRRFDGEKELGVDPYFLGVWFGDGSVRRGIRISNPDPEIGQALEAVAKVWNLRARRVVQRRSDGQVPCPEWRLVVPGGSHHGLGRNKAPNPLMHAIREVVDGDSLSMEAIKRAPWEQRAEFLAGIIDTDGSVHNECAIISQKRADWAAAIAFVARSLGLRAIETAFTVPGYGEYHRVSLSGDTHHIPTRIARKKFGPRRQKKNALRSGFAVEPLGVDRYYGFTVGGDGRYLLGDFTVTHNTFLMACVTLFLLGQDPTTRGAIVSATQEQAEKVLSVVADYIAHSAQLRRVFPELRRSRRVRDKWNQTALTVDRPPGIADPSLYAVGTHGALAGSRLNWIIVDDVLNFENTLTPEARAKVYGWLDSTVLSRLDPVGARVVITNTPWHPKDLVHQLEDLGWASLRMDVLGNVLVQDDAFWAQQGRPQWDCPDLRPASGSSTEVRYRLRAHDPDPENEVPLWPEKFPAEVIEEKRSTMHAVDFARAFLCAARDDATAMCKQEYVDLCLKAARDAKVHSLVSRYDGQNPTFTGVDLAFGMKSHHDKTAFFTFEVLEDGGRRILDIDVGQWPGPEILKRLLAKQAAYNSVVRVESNGAQILIQQFAQQTNRSLPIKTHTTTLAGKAHPQFGVAGLFLEMANGAWLIPNDPRQPLHPMVKAFIEACLFYVPSKHTPDVIMASFFAREQARAWGMLAPKRKDGQNGKGSIQASILSR